MSNNQRENLKSRLERTGHGLYGLNGGTMLIHHDGNVLFPNEGGLLARSVRDVIRALDMMHEISDLLHSMNLNPLYGCDSQGLLVGAYSEADKFTIRVSIRPSSYFPCVDMEIADGPLMINWRVRGAASWGHAAELLATTYSYVKGE